MAASDLTKSRILAAIKNTAAGNGGAPLGWRRFKTETGIRDSEWKGIYWARWSDAIREAGFVPHALTGAHDSGEMLQKCADLALQLGRLPTASDMRLSAHQGLKLPSDKTLARHFGGMAGLVEALSEFCKTRSQYLKVIDMCGRYVPRLNGTDEELDPAPETTGYVYLIKSGRYYKIGRSNSAGRREYELKLQLPERPDTVHTIETDDPCGIEAYWHHRFKSKRKHGEWFELDTADVKAFKRRRIFM
jgi:Meiotically up-regulated gene 113